MQIQSASTVCAYPNVSSPTNRAAAVASSTATTASLADTVAISTAARDLYATQSNPTTAVYDTDQGAKNLDIDAYFSPTTKPTSFATLPPLLLPTQNNADALSSHISAAFPQFLARNHIPAAPAKITYDSAGQMQLPADYPYASELKQALAGEPAMARELSTVSALTSHLVEMKKSIPFQQEYAAAKTRAEADAVVAKYSYLFSGNRRCDSIALQFSADGTLTLTDDGKPLS